MPFTSHILSIQIIFYAMLWDHPNFSELDQHTEWFATIAKWISNRSRVSNIWHFQKKILRGAVRRQANLMMMMMMTTMRPEYMDVVEVSIYANVHWTHVNQFQAKLFRWNLKNISYNRIYRWRDSVGGFKQPNAFWCECTRIHLNSTTQFYWGILVGAK